MNHVDSAGLSERIESAQGIATIQRRPPKRDDLLFKLSYGIENTIVMKSHNM